MIFAALTESADRGELLLADGGLCRFHRRRDGTVTIRELLVLPARRRNGLGRALVAWVADLNPRAQLVARCPVVYESNAFWAACGFALEGTEKGVNLWRRPASPP